MSLSVRTVLPGGACIRIYNAKRGKPRIHTKDYVYSSIRSEILPLRAHPQRKLVYHPINKCSDRCVIYLLGKLREQPLILL